MKDVQIDADLFKGDEPAEQFLDTVCHAVKEANGNLVPIYRDGKVFAYAVSPQSPFWENFVSHA